MHFADHSIWIGSPAIVKRGTWRYASQQRRAGEFATAIWIARIRRFLLHNWHMITLGWAAVIGSSGG